MEGQSLDDGHLCGQKLPRGVSMSIETGMSVTGESANIVPDSVRDGHPATVIAGALCADVPCSWETEIAHFLATNDRFPNLRRHHLGIEVASLAGVPLGLSATIEDE
jgi:hypothetical protein